MAWNSSPPSVIVSLRSPTNLSESSAPHGSANLSDAALYMSTKVLIEPTRLPLESLFSSASIEHLAPFLVLNFLYASLQTATSLFSLSCPATRYFSASSFASTSIFLTSLGLSSEFSMFFTSITPSFASGNNSKKLLSAINLLISSSLNIFFLVVIITYRYVICKTIFMVQSLRTY